MSDKEKHCPWVKDPEGEGKLPSGNDTMSSSVVEKIQKIRKNPVFRSLVKDLVRDFL